MIADDLNLKLSFLIQELACGLSVRKKNKGREFITSNLILFEKGTAYLYKENGSVLFQVSGPMILGLDNLYNNTEISVCFMQDTEYYSATKETARKIIESNNQLLLISCKILMHQIAILCEKESLSSQKTKYDSVKKYLEIIWGMEENERANISIFKYIMMNMNISRSSLYKILHELNKGGFIKTERGRLVYMSKLPSAF
ncbi:helix-turn-helix domain-containing protein [Serratia fonticola]